ncbi:hypothetical protein AWM68_08625 [Fictibacillus phosphorivorans]|uniref:Uncharacterized protein n=1 Tax=Fictibacillus phosphorivorans TaxID=1221500 RepID=A0A161RRM2_9BACL|nr:hypothetical protein [Fictibacillus phosphorivorans]KZE66413.1 hypothetical protein AWM68_08625 [Fictibacillus phosphorivorans]
MKVYYGYENIESADINVHDQHEDLIIVSDTIVDFHETIPLLHINPIQTTLLYEDYGFVSDSQNHYVYLDMICAFFIIDTDEQPEKDMFLLQMEEELIATCKEEKRIYILDKHHQLLIKKWATAYNLDVEFILF